MASPIDPGLAAVFEQIKAAGAALPDPAEVGVEAGRAARARYYEFLNGGEVGLPVDAVADASLDGPHGKLPVRIWHPTPERPAPAILFFHGGGWWTGNLAAYEQVCRRLAVESGCAVVYPEYALWPEKRFPAPVEECLFATDWVLGEGAAHGLDPSRIAFAGDSAGATLGLYCAAERKGTGAVRALALVYGVYQHDTGTASWRELGDGSYGLTVAQMDWIWEGYLQGSGAARDDPRLAPLHADLAGLPYTWVMAGDLDPLIDDSRALAARLDALGVPYHLKIEEGMTHFIWMWQRLFARSRASISEAGAILKRELRR